MYGWQGKIGVINLTTRTVHVETPAPWVYHTYIGGRGLSGFYLKDDVGRHWEDPLMPLIFFTGPLVNTPSPTSGRMTIMSRSPLTGTIGDTSVGGTLGTMLKRAGFDGLIMIGKSGEACGVEIEDQSVRIVAARHLTGMKTSEIYQMLKPKGAVACTGPAAENKVRFANIIVDGHFAAGRNGLGCIFNAKNLKYVTITGKGKTRVYDKDKLKKGNEDIVRLTKASPAVMGKFGITNFGTGALYDLMDSRAMMPTDNFRRTKFEAAQTMNAYRFHTRYKPRKSGCKGCHILCKKKAVDGRMIPEFETLSHFSALIGNSDMETVMAANQRCNELGMDTISAAGTLACYSEISHTPLTGKHVLELLDAMGHGTGMGEALGKGGWAYAQDAQKPELFMGVKGQDLSAYDPRGALGMALSFAVSTRGACHLRAYPISHEILRKPVATDRFSFAGKARMIKIAEDLNAVVDSLTACKFIFFAASLEEYAVVYEAVTGIAATGHELLRLGERICYMERVMNFQNGFTQQEDDLPARFFQSPGSQDGTLVIPPIDRKAFLKARSDYYRVRGLKEDGAPDPEWTRKMRIGGIL